MSAYYKPAIEEVKKHMNSQMNRLQVCALTLLKCVVGSLDHESVEENLQGIV